MHEMRPPDIKFLIHPVMEKLYVIPLFFGGEVGKK